MESLNNKIEKAIRFNNYEQAIKKCTDISNNHVFNVLHHLDKKLYEKSCEASIEEFNLIVELRAKIIYPLIAEAAQDYPDWSEVEDKPFSN